MKKFLWMLAVSLGVVFTLAPTDADARRFGGGKSSGMQRTAPSKAPDSAPATPAANPNTPPAGAAGAAPKRSWMGPIAGLAAGLGIAALFSAFGMGEGLANVVTLALLAFVAVALIRMLMRRLASSAPTMMAAGPQAGAAAAAPAAAAPTRFVDERPGMQRNSVPPVTIGSALQPPLAMPGGAAQAAPTLPAGFDGEGFERLAKMLFIRMQAANDNADLNDLRSFTTPELFASLRIDLQDRGDAKQQTDVVKIDAKLIDFEQAAEQQIVSVRYTGLVREAEDDKGADATPFDEVWHLVKPLDDSRNWAVAGVQQAQ